MVEENGVESNLNLEKLQKRGLWAVPLAWPCHADAVMPWNVLIHALPLIQSYGFSRNMTHRGFL